ncbi:uncharacterized protein LOC142987627 [Anticarsia gemmatalis]|uniref:uncharacterized protein LOC142987627 n=1 Tax=Anticarsia gemmatalis TaxID=129554 RepID=UPI003F76A962
MISLLVRLGLALLVLNALFTPADAWGSYRNPNKGYQDPAKPKTFAGDSAGIPSQNTTRKGLGISAWGIVFAVVGLILVIMGLYYVSICYSVCQPTKNKYDKMGLPTMA